MVDHFVNIHVHTHYSNNGMLDSIAKVDDIITRVKELGQTALAITDHGTVSGLIDGYKQAKEAGLHFIFGSEFYFVPEVGVKERGNHHLVLIAKNQEGYKNLLKLSTIAGENFYYKPRIDYDVLKAHSRGLIATSACLGGIFNITDEEGKWDKEANIDRLLWFKEVFGENLYIELHTNQMKEQIAHNKLLVSLAEEYGIPMIACVDSHYVHESQFQYQRAWVGIGENDERNYYSTNDYFIMSSKQVKDRLSYLPKDCVERAIQNTSTLANSCHVEIDFKSKHYPMFTIPEGETSQLEYLKKICRDGWKRKILNRVPKELQKIYGDRVKEELGVLVECDYINYFLITHDMLDWCKNRANPPVFTGIGRGSVGGSLVAYLMDISKIDPIKTDLLFSRFAHTARISPPDIDNDIERARRQEVIEYVRQKYNGDVYQCRTFGYCGDKGALKRAGQALHIPHDEVNKLSKQIKTSLDDIKDNKYKKLVELAKAFVGLIQNYSTHASALILCPEDPCNWFAVERNSDTPVCCYEFGDVEEMGLLKIDGLGLRTIDVIHGTLDGIGGDRANGFDIENLPDNDPKTLVMLQEGKTTGCFQIESSGMTKLVKDMRPEEYSDMIPLVALYRPGCLQAGMVDVFVKRRAGEEEIEYLHPLMEEALKDTYGVILYQEQIQKLANILAGYDMGEADLLRRAIGKKKPEVLVQIKPEFISRMVEYLKNTDTPEKIQETAEKVWELIEYFGGYGFNKSHSATYGYTSYQTAYLKAHYPVEFMCSLLNAYADESQENMIPYIEEIKSLGIEILPPNINKSELHWTIEVTEEGRKAIRVGLSYIKGVGKLDYHKPVRNLVEIRKGDHKISKGKLEALAKAGALDCLGISRSELLMDIADIDRNILKARNKMAEDFNRIQELKADLNKIKDTTKKYEQTLKQIGNREKAIEKGKEKVKELQALRQTLQDYSIAFGERDVLGFSFIDILTQFDLAWAKVPDLDSGVEHIIGGELTRFKKHTQKNGKPMAFITMRTAYGTVDLVMFNSSYEELIEGQVYLVSIKENKITDTFQAKFKNAS